MRIRDLRKNEKGATLVEMIVSFALIGIFLAATFTAVSSALVTYYHERELMAAYTVADTVISSIKDDIHTMRPQRLASTDDTYESLDGYVKIRDGSTSTSVGSTVTTLSDGNSDGSNEYYGDTIEFLRAASYNITNDEAADTDISFVETINSSGFSGTLYKKTDVISVDSSGNNGAVSRDSGYLTLRYYSRNSESTYKNLGADLLLTDSGLGSDSISRGLTEKLGSDYYNGLYVDLHFFIPESALETDTLSVGNAANFVRFVGVTVDVYREYDGTTFSDQLYSKTEYIDIQNDVWFANYKTLYSDLSDSTLSEIPVQKN